MQRREFLQESALGLTGVTIANTVQRSVNKLTIEVNQTVRLTNWLSKNRKYNVAEAIEITQKVVENVFRERFSIEFEVVKGNTNIPSNVLKPGFNDNISHFHSLSRWIASSENTEANIKLLLGHHPNETGGIASAAVLPYEMKPVKPHGIVWGGFYNKDNWNFRREVAHEIGHTIGMYHGYGTNFENGKRSLMHRKAFARKFSHNYFGEKVKPEGKRSIVINPKVKENHINV
jgi:hypothetical protein